MENKKIIIDTKIFEIQRYGGISRLWVELIKQMRYLPNVEIQGRKHLSKNNILVDKTGICNLITKRKQMSWITKGYFKFLPKDSVTFFSYYQFGIGLGMSIVVLHDFMVFDEEGIRNKIKQLQIILSLLLAKSVVCVSDKTANELQKRYPKISKKSVTIENPLSLDFLSNEILGERCNGMAIYVGKRVGLKNFDEVKWLLENLKNISLYVVGPEPIGHEKKRYSEYIESGRMRFLGELQDKEYISLLAQSTFLFLPSIDEGFGFPFIEAGACGTPVISRLSGDFLGLNNNHIYQYKKRENITLCIEKAESFSKEQRINIRQEITDRFSPVNCALKYIELSKL